MAKVLNASQLLRQQQDHKLINLDENLFPDGGPHRNSLIQISGESNTGKSLLLWQLMASSLPTQKFGGKNCGVLFINLGHKFEVQNFARIIELFCIKSQQSNTAILSGELHLEVRRCLDSAKIINCFNPDDFELTMHDISTILLQNVNVGLIAIDSLCDLYWLEKFPKPLRMLTYFNQTVARLKNICSQYNVCCVFTIDSNVTDIKAWNKSAKKPKSSTTDIDYKILLKVLADGRSRTLNDKPFYINENGFQFEF